MIEYVLSTRRGCGVGRGGDRGIAVVSLSSTPLPRGRRNEEMVRNMERFVSV